MSDTVTVQMNEAELSDGSKVYSIALIDEDECGFDFHAVSEQDAIELGRKLVEALTSHTNIVVMSNV